MFLLPSLPPVVTRVHTLSASDACEDWCTVTAVLTTCQLTPHARPTPHTDSRCNNLSHRDWPSTSHPQRQGHAGAASILRHRHHHLDGRSVTSPSSVATSPSGTCGCRGAVPVCVCARACGYPVFIRVHTHTNMHTHSHSHMPRIPLRQFSW